MTERIEVQSQSQPHLREEGKSPFCQRYSVSHHFKKIKEMLTMFQTVQVSVWFRPQVRRRVHGSVLEIKSDNL